MGADVNSVNDEGDTPLHLAVLHQQEKLVVLLMDAGGWRLHYFLHSQFRMALGSNVNIKNNSGNVCLHLAAYMGDIGIVEMLISADADLDATNKQNDTPLLLACLKGNQAMVGFMLRKGGMSFHTKA